MNARANACERLGGRYETRVLEPSPPAVTDDPRLADDPAARGDVPAGRSVVSPVRTGDLRWDDLAATDPGLAAWCADRWLGGYRRLGPVPPRLIPTRTAMRRVAEHVVASGKIAPITTLHAAAEQVGRGRPPDDVQLDPEQLDVDPAAAAFLGDCNGFAASVLEELRAEAGDDVDPSLVQLWSATGFSAAELPYSDLLSAPDQRETALAFFRARLWTLVA